MRIALEEHFTVDHPEHIDRWLSMVTQVSPTITQKAIDQFVDVGERRLERMAKARIDKAVLSNIGLVQGNLDPHVALRMSREANDYLARVVQTTPDRYAGFATVPLQQPDKGADELERAVKDLGLVGTLLLGQTNGEYYDDRKFDPFWERAQDLDVPVYLHAADAQIMPVTYAGHPEMLGATWSWTPETASHVLRLIWGGVFKRFPKVKLIVGHMGETLPYMFWRLDRRVEAFGLGNGIKASDVMRNNVVVTTSAVFSDTPFKCALEAMGDDRIVFSVDFPFEDMDYASDWLDKAPVSDKIREKVSWKNAARLLKI